MFNVWFLFTRDLVFLQLSFGWCKLPGLHTSEWGFPGGNWNPSGRGARVGACACLIWTSSWQSGPINWWELALAQLFPIFSFYFQLFAPPTAELSKPTPTWRLRHLHRVSARWWSRTASLVDVRCVTLPRSTVRSLRFIANMLSGRRKALSLARSK